jgi:hypothetical protein
MRWWPRWRRAPNSPRLCRAADHRGYLVCPCRGSPINAQTAIAGGQTREMNDAKAIREVLALVLERDKTVILMGEDIGVFGGAVAAPG